MKNIDDRIKPGTDAEEVTPSDTVDLSSPSRALWVGVSGDIKVIMQGRPDGGDGSTVTFVGVSGLLPIRVSRVYSTGTTATDIVSIL